MFPKLKLKLRDEIANKFLTFALKNYDNLDLFIKNNSGYGRYFCNLLNINSFDMNFLHSLRKEMYEEIHILEFKEEPFFGIFLGVNRETAFVHAHTDPADKDHYHTRINFLLSKPIAGGMPIIEGKEYLVEENEAWLNLASSWKHSSTPVFGEKPRVVLSIGANVPVNIIQKLNYDKLQ